MQDTGTYDLLRQVLLEDLDFHDQNGNYASHNFHSFPAKFPPQLPRKFINEFTIKGDTVLDPMVGSGTTVVESFLLERNSIGFDIDPLSLLISKIKISDVNPEDIQKDLYNIIDKASKRLTNSNDNLRFEISHYFDEETLRFLDTWFLPTTEGELFSLSQEILLIENERLRNFFKVAFSSIIITKSGGVSLALDLGHTRPHLAKQVLDVSGNIMIGEKNGLIPHYQTKIIRSAYSEFEKRCLVNIKGLNYHKGLNSVADIRFSNAQSLPLENNSIDLVITSPPYASNAIDYMRAHKFSLVWFGYPINELGNKRREYIGNEATTNFEFEEIPTYPQLIIQRIMEKDTKKAYSLFRYFSEMKRVLCEMYRVLKPNKIAIVVVGNSILKGINTEIPFCLSEIGKSVGFRVPAIGVRQLDRNKRMMPVGRQINYSSTIQQRMHEEYVIGFLKE